MIHYLQRPTLIFLINVFENYTIMHNIIKRMKKKIPNTEFYTPKRYASKIKVKTSNVSFDVKNLEVVLTIFTTRKKSKESKEQVLFLGPLEN